MPEINDLGIVG